MEMTPTRNRSGWLCLYSFSYGRFWAFTALTQLEMKDRSAEHLGFRIKLEKITTKAQHYLSKICHASRLSSGRRLRAPERREVLPPVTLNQPFAFLSLTRPTIMKKSSLLRGFATMGIATSFLTLTFVAPAQVPFSGGAYIQNFDTLAQSGTANAWTDNTTLPGWYAGQSAGTFAGYNGGTGSSTAGALYSLGSAAVPGDRALGSLASNGTGNFGYGVRFANDTAQTITNITVTYTGEQWRNGGNTTPQTLSFSYRVSNSPITTPDAPNTGSWTSVSALSFTSPIATSSGAALDGNVAANRHVFSSIELTGASVAPGQEIFLRWLDLNDAGNDHGLAVDDLSVTFNSITSVTNPPQITTQPQSRTNNAGTVATFTVVADGTALNYQWRLNDVDLFNGVKVNGATSPTLTVSSVLANDAGITLSLSTTARARSPAWSRL